ncbi:MAG: rSAM-modified peptide [Bacteroidales bacterium]|nr:MAG: rSAM-modified peptide [Bacteroidales bacterium]
MKTSKKLKLDTLSSNELENKEANQIKGGQPICRCFCFCDTTTVKISERSFDSRDVYQFERP